MSDFERSRVYGFYPLRATLVVRSRFGSWSMAEAGSCHRSIRVAVASSECDGVGGTLGANRAVGVGDGFSCVSSPVVYRLPLSQGEKLRRCPILVVGGVSPYPLHTPRY